MIQLSLIQIYNIINTYGYLSEKEEREQAEEFTDKLVNKFLSEGLDAYVDSNSTHHKLLDPDGDCDLDPWMEEIIDETVKEWHA